jgi:hypothetical protein
VRTCVHTSSRAYEILESEEFFWNITPSSPLNFNRRFGETCQLYHQGRRISRARKHHEAGSKLVFCLFYSSALKMKMTCSAETSVDFQRTTRRYIAEERTLHYHRCQNLTFYIRSNFIPKRASYISGTKRGRIVIVLVLYRYGPDSLNKDLRRLRISNGENYIIRSVTMCILHLPSFVILNQEG